MSGQFNRKLKQNVSVCLNGKVNKIGDYVEE